MRYVGVVCCVVHNGYDGVDGFSLRCKSIYIDWFLRLRVEVY